MVLISLCLVLSTILEMKKKMRTEFGPAGSQKSRGKEKNQCDCQNSWVDILIW